MKVFVYWNSTKKVWSVKVLATGLVEWHFNEVVLTDAKPKVSEAGRQRVLREKKKNVHAGMVGTLHSYNDFVYVPDNARQIKYNPYYDEHFVYKDTGAEFLGADAVVMIQGKVLAVWEKAEASETISG